MAKKETPEQTPAGEALMNKINELENALQQQQDITAGKDQAIGELTSENEMFKSQIEDLKKEVEVLLKGDGAVAKEKETGIGGVFELDGKKYKILLHAASIPGVGRRTAFEILNDPDAQAKLVATQSGVIKEVS